LIVCWTVKPRSDPRYNSRGKARLRNIEPGLFAIIMISVDRYLKYIGQGTKHSNPGHIA